MQVKKLESGYWHVRWNANLWLQWPDNSSPRMSDGFGWITEQHVRDAAEATQRITKQEAGDAK